MILPNISFALSVICLVLVNSYRIRTDAKMVTYLVHWNSDPNAKVPFVVIWTMANLYQDENLMNNKIGCVIW
jgi:hypothetical protein